MKTRSIAKTLIGIAALAASLSAAAQVDQPDCPTAQAEAALAARHVTHAPREIGIEQAARFGLVLPCAKTSGSEAEQQAQRRQMVAELEGELARARASGSRGGFRPELYGLALPNRQQARIVRVAATPASYDAPNARPARLESGG